MNETEEQAWKANYLGVDQDYCWTDVEKYYETNMED